LTVADNGSGFDTARKPVIGVYGMGMTTMRERAEAIGAQLSMDSAMGQGTRVIVRIPSSVGLAE
jgi:signal transduction histidine kinase